MTNDVDALSVARNCYIRDLSLDRPMINSLQHSGLETLEDIAQLSEAALLKIPNIGRGRISDIKALLATQGLCLIPDGQSGASAAALAMEDIRTLLKQFGCQHVRGILDKDRDWVMVTFTYRQRGVSVRANYERHAKEWLKEQPSETRNEHKALKQAEVSLCLFIRDWIEKHVMAVEPGILSIKDAFRIQLLRPNGSEVLEAVFSMRPAPLPPETERRLADE